MMVTANNLDTEVENELISPQIKWKSFSEDMVLDKDEVHVLKVEISSYYESIADNHTQILSEAELNKSSKYIRRADSERYIAVRHLVRTILSRMLQIAPQDIEFSVSENKKPCVKGIEFNISHSGNYILLAIAPKAVGIDIELINPDFDYETVSSITFTPKEVLFIKSNDDSAFNFYTLWTRKEAILKATGEGLTDDMDKVQCLDEEVERNHINYRLISFKIENNYVACLATTNKNQKINYLEYNCR